MKRTLKKVFFAALSIWVISGSHTSAAHASTKIAEPCRVQGYKHEVLCGSISRPLNPSRPQGVHIGIHFVVVPALARNKLPDPVFMFAGGPGQSATSLVGQTMPLFEKLNFRRDIVFVDQRGTGKSAPLACQRESGSDFDQITSFNAMLEKLSACRAELQKLPYGDLRFFTTEIAMRDMDAVREHLGAMQINAVGGSYGTRALLDYMRQFPGHVRRAVLDGVAPPDMALPLSFSTDNQQALDSALRACEADSACSKRYPALRDGLQRLMQNLPQTTAVTDPVSGEVRHIIMTQDVLLGAVRSSLYASTVASALPAALHAAVHGRFEPLLGLASTFGMKESRDRPPRLFTGMHLSVICSEDLPRLPLAASTDQNPAGATFSTQQKEFYLKACADWPRAVVSPSFYTVPAAATPVLLLSGGADPATPPRHAERTAKLLGVKAVHLVAPHVAHGVMGNPCGARLVTRFIADDNPAEALRREGGCLADMPRPGVFITGRVIEGAAHD